MLGRMATAEEHFLERLRADPNAHSGRLARELGLSNRAARRLVAQITAEGFVRAHRRRHATLTILGLAALLASSYGLYKLVTSSPVRVPRSEKVVAIERALYGALDRRDRSRTSEALEHLRSAGDDSLRLAALRYLTGVQAQEHVEQIAPAVDDSSERVRVAAIQLVARLEGPVVEGALVQVAVSSDRAQSERLLALAGLKHESRAGARSKDLARSLLPALRDSSPVIRAEAGGVLEFLTRSSVKVGPTPPEAFHEAWTALLATSTS